MSLFLLLVGYTESAKCSELLENMLIFEKYFTTRYRKQYLTTRYRKQDRFSMYNPVVTEKTKA